GIWHWARALRFVLTTDQLVDHLHIVWFLLLFPAALALLVVAWDCLPVAEALFATGATGLVLLSGHATGPGLDGTGRHLMTVFPLFLSAGVVLRRHGALLAVCAVFLPFLLWFTYLFSHWKPVT